MWGISYPGFYVSAGMIDAHPALVAASPQAPVTDYYLGDDSFHNGAFLLAHNFSFYVSFLPRPGGPAPPRAQTAFDWGTPGRLRVLPADGAAFQLEHEVPEGRQPVLEHQPRPPQLRRVLAGTVPLEALQGHQAGGADRRRLVRRRRPAGSAAHVSDHRADEPRGHQHHRHGPVDARQLVARRRRQGRPGHVWIEGLRVVSRARRVPVFRQAPQGASRPRRCPRR